VTLLVLQTDAAAGTHQPLRGRARVVASREKASARGRVERVLDASRRQGVAGEAAVPRVLPLKQPVQVRRRQERGAKVGPRTNVKTRIVGVEPRGARKDRTRRVR